MLNMELIRASAARLDVPLIHELAMAEVESSGEPFWNIDGVKLPAVRFEAHHFSARTGHKFDATNPDLSSHDWNPSLAAKTWRGAWDQVRRAEALDDDAAKASTSWGPFQVMGFNSAMLGYNSVDSFVDAMNTEAGQIEAFERFIRHDDILHRALRSGEFETVETHYNGGGYGGLYAAKLRAAVDRLGGAAGQLAIQSGVSPIRALRKGDQGPDVIAVQVALGITPVDGIFGPDTDRAVRNFQQSHGLVPDGIVGRMTKAELGLVK